MVFLQKTRQKASGFQPGDEWRFLMSDAVVHYTSEWFHY
jgi:hypothetical protein